MAAHVCIFKAWEAETDRLWGTLACLAKTASSRFDRKPCHKKSDGRRLPLSASRLCRCLLGMCTGINTHTHTLKHNHILHTYTYLHPRTQAYTLTLLIHTQTHAHIHALDDKLLYSLKFIQFVYTSNSPTKRKHERQDSDISILLPLRYQGQCNRSVPLCQQAADSKCFLGAGFGCLECSRDLMRPSRLKVTVVC